MSNEEIMAQIDQIRGEIASEQPPIGPRSTFDSLYLQYAPNPVFTRKLHSVSRKYPALRRVRADGNCFYRAFLFGCLEFAVRFPLHPAVSRLYEAFASSLERLQTIGYGRIAFEDFYDVVMEVVCFATERPALTAAMIDEAADAAARLRDPFAAKISASSPSATELASEAVLVDSRIDELLRRLNEPSTSLYMVSYLRVLTSAQLKLHDEDYLPYLPETPDGLPYTSMTAFCASEVEPMDRDVEHVQCMALAAALRMKVRIEYVDQSEGDVVGYEMPEGDATIPADEPPSAFLLYRPGHYDVLYRA